MGYHRILMRGAVALATFSLVFAISASGPAWAADADSTTRQERQHERADTLREQSKERAGKNLGYEDVISDQQFQRNIDFYALGQQIRRLGALIQRLADPAGAGPSATFGPNVPSPAPGADMSNIYGPDGPTEKTVRLLLEYRLMVAGNPRLKVGSVEDEGDKVMASVVTADGSMVEKYAIDKQTGNWAAVRD